MDAKTPKFQGGHLHLEIYIAGKTPAGERAISNMQKMCEEICIVGAYEITIINIRENPEAAEAQKILATLRLCEFPPSPSCR